jgi:hypothetical protein
MNIISFSIYSVLLFATVRHLQSAAMLLVFITIMLLLHVILMLFLDQTVLFNCFIANRLSHC